MAVLFLFALVTARASLTESLSVRDETGRRTGDMREDADADATCFGDRIREAVGSDGSESGALLDWNAPDPAGVNGQELFAHFVAMFPALEDVSPALPASADTRLLRGDLCTAAKWLKRCTGGCRHVLLACAAPGASDRPCLNDDLGALSAYVPGRTSPIDGVRLGPPRRVDRAELAQLLDGGTLPEHHTAMLDFYSDAGCSEQDIRSYLDSHEVAAVFTLQHQAFAHPKVHALPVGLALQTAPGVYRRLRENRAKTRLLMINDSGYGFRQDITAAVLAQFPGAANTYARGPEATGNYLDELAQSKFVLCPPGVGYDSYRLWEALALGTVPVLEKDAGGWHHVADDLPVLWVEKFSDVTPALLNDAYPAIVGRCGEYNFAKLRRSWWRDLVQGYLK